jgi:hypothetical protein
MNRVIPNKPVNRVMAWSQVHIDKYLRTKEIGSY